MWLGKKCFGVWKEKPGYGNLESNLRRTTNPQPWRKSNLLRLRQSHCGGFRTDRRKDLPHERNSQTTLT